MKEERRRRHKLLDYKQIQVDESAHSRGTVWGDRVADSVGRTMYFINGNILEIGCGDGLALELLYNEGFNVKGLDISPEKVKIARDHGLDVIEGLMEDLPFEDKEFDTTLCFHTLEHSSDIDKALSEIERVSHRAIIIVPIEESTGNPAHYSPIASGEYLKSKIAGNVIYERHLIRGEREYLIVVDYGSVRDDEAKRQE